MEIFISPTRKLHCTYVLSDHSVPYKGIQILRHKNKVAKTSSLRPSLYRAWENADNVRDKLENHMLLKGRWTSSCDHSIMNAGSQPAQASWGSHTAWGTVLHLRDTVHNFHGGKPSPASPPPWDLARPCRLLCTWAKWVTGPFRGPGTVCVLVTALSYRMLFKETSKEARGSCPLL